MEPMSANERLVYTWLLGASLGKSIVIGFAIVIAALINMGGAG
jgi:hypothetical protein